MIKKSLTIAGLFLAIMAGLWNGVSWVNSNVAWSADLKATNEAVKALNKSLQYDVETNRLFRMQTTQRDIYKDYPKPDKAPPAIQRQMKSIDDGVKMQEQRVIQMEPK